jgi:hypothetical protein
MIDEKELAVLLQPNQATIELLLALIGHLFDRRQVEPAALATLLKNRISILEKEDFSIVPILKAQIQWLERLRPGEPIPPMLH